jgi:hypothetical protein
MGSLISGLIKKWIPILIATITGVVVLLGYLYPNHMLVYYGGSLTEWRDVLIEWAVIVAAFAFLLGVFNIVRVHGGRVSRRRQGWLYSLVLLLAMLVAMVVPLVPSSRMNPDELVFEHVIGPLGASLAALMVFTLTLAALHLLRARRSPGAALFMFIVVVALLGSTPLAGLAGTELLADIRDWLIHVPGMAGMRGLLLGVALGTVITGLRVLVASDRPHSEF